MLQEREDIFFSGQRYPIERNRTYFILYHFPKKQAEDIILEFQNSDFFAQEGWKPFKAVDDMGFASERMNMKDPSIGDGVSNVDEAVQIIVLRGLYRDDMNSLKAKDGSTVLLIPRSAHKLDEQQ